jgi:hypothetical protein
VDGRLGGDRRVYARQVLDAGSALRARSGEAERNNARLQACLGRLNDSLGRLVARFLGQLSSF